MSKTNFDIICKDIDYCKSIKSSLFDQINTDLKQFYEDTLITSKDKWYLYINIINVDYNEQNILITGFTSDGYETTHEIPREWYENREKYIEDVKINVRNTYIKNLKNSIAECERVISYQKLEIEKANKKLKELNII